jgi:hypothetical protein
VLVSYEEARQIIPSLIGAGFNPQDKQFYLVDGNRLDYSGDFDEGVMEGTIASQPIGAGEQADLIAQVEESHGEPLPETAYVPEAYDAMMLVALGAIPPGTDLLEPHRGLRDGVGIGLGIGQPVGEQLHLEGQQLHLGAHACNVVEVGERSGEHRLVQDLQHPLVPSQQLLGQTGTLEDHVQVG